LSINTWHEIDDYIYKYPLGLTYFINYQKTYFMATNHGHIPQQTRSRNWTPDNETDKREEETTFDDTFVSGYDEDYEEDEDLDENIMHNRREAVKSMGGRSRANKVTDRRERSVTGEKNREQGYAQRSGAATPKARKGNTEKK
jgi:hypothetical protein